MKITLYIRRHPNRPHEACMFARLEDEPCYDTPRVSNLGTDIKAALDKIIANCESAGYITPPKKETQK